MDISLHRDNALLATILTRSYWQSLAPELNVDILYKSMEIRDGHLSVTERKHFQELFVNRGYYQLRKRHMKIKENIILKLANSVKKLLKLGWPPSFIFMFDEVWGIIDAMKEDFGVMEENEFIGDIYAWCVDPNLQQKGWGPHRDRMGSTPESFKGENRTPKLSTTWLALTDATPENSCLYVLPADKDPLYYKSDEPTINPLHVAFNQSDNYQYIRCLSCKAGEANHFSHRLIHWGSQADPSENVKPRIALSWVIGDKSFEKPAFNSDSLPYPSIQHRLGLICGQIISYGGQTNLKKGFRDLCYRIYKQTRHLLTVDYRDKVEYLYFMRPPPLNIHLSVRMKAEIDKEIEVSELDMPTEKDNLLVQGINQMFIAEGDIDSSSEEEDST